MFVWSLEGTRGKGRGQRWLDTYLHRWIVLSLYLLEYKEDAMECSFHMGFKWLLVIVGVPHGMSYEANINVFLLVQRVQVLDIQSFWVPKPLDSHL